MNIENQIIQFLKDNKEASSTYLEVKDHFKCSSRGKVDVKNIGLVDIYHVEG
jgi:hypothetical protein